MARYAASENRTSGAESRVSLVFNGTGAIFCLVHLVLSLTLIYFTLTFKPVQKVIKRNLITLQSFVKLVLATGYLFFIL